MKGITLIIILFIAFTSVSFAQNSGIHLEEDNGDVTLKLEADTDDNNEDDNPRIEFIHDGGYGNSSIGLNIFENGNDNGLFFANNTSARGGIFFATNETPTGWENSIVRMTISNSGNIGVGTQSPNAKIQVNDGDIYIEDIDKGVIMRSPNGQCWRMTVSNSGNPVFTSLVCP